MYFNLKIASVTNVVFFPFNCIFYRIHEGQEINNKISYLCFNYLYLNDALSELDLYLNKNQIKYLMLKNKIPFSSNFKK